MCRRCRSISLRFAEWIAKYTLAPLGMVVRMMMSARAVFEPVKPRFGVTLVEGAAEPPRMTPARKRALEIAGDGAIRAKAALALAAECSSGVVDGLVASGNLVEVAIPDKRPPLPDPHHRVTEFGEEQTAAVHALRSAVDGGNFSTTLLDGVTGSGKTEVYFEAVARTLERGQQAPIMLPEIALTGSVHAPLRGALRLRAGRMAFGAVGPRARPRVAQAATGEARVIVGARSALFLPFSDLGLIVVDEEHDAGFKQDDRVHYQARDMAVVRGNLGGFPVILASATPSIESHVNARTGRYRHVDPAGTLFRRRSCPTSPPSICARRRPKRANGCRPCWPMPSAETLAAGQQSLLFLNRRGYAPLTLCRSCGHRIECPQCTAWLVEHRFRGKLHCHHCGFSLPMPEKCPKCAEPGSLVACGPGVERVAEEVAERFPQARVALLSSDLVPGLTEMRDMIRNIEAGGIDIIIGTQMVAKGHHFPNLATVGIVDGDLGLAQGADPRAGERTFQLLHQVTGRAGRALALGRGFVQTHMPDHPVMEAIISGDREAFLEREIANRRKGLLPPYGRLVALVVAARDKETAQLVARDIAHRAPPVGQDRGSGSGRSAARRHPRPAPLAAAGQGAARDRRAGLPARLARRLAAAERRHQAHRRHRPL